MPELPAASIHLRDAGADADLRAEKIVIDGLSTRFEVVRKGEVLGAVTIPTPGVHVAINSLAATAIALELGISFAVAAKALSVGNLKQVFTNEGRAIDWFDAKQGEGRWFLDHTVQVKNIWVSYGE